MSYSTLMDGYSKGKHIDDMHMLNVYDEMKHLFIRLDKEYNSTLVRVYGNIGMFSKAMGKFREMETCGIKINSKLQCND